MAALESEAEARALATEARETALRGEIAALEEKLGALHQRETGRVFDWAEVMGAALHSSMESLAVSHATPLRPACQT